MGSVWFGNDIPDDSELRLVGDVKGKRVLELGLPPTHPNSVVMAQGGARVLAVDTSAERIAIARRAAEAAGVKVEFHEAGLSELGFERSGTLDLVLCVERLAGVDDVDRLLRQAHRVLKPEAAFVAVLEHPAHAMFDGDEPIARRRYGTATNITIGDLCMSLQRSNFAIDVLYELYANSKPRAVVPCTLAIRARKLGS